MMGATSQTALRFAARNANIPQALRELKQWARWIKGTRDKMPANLDNTAMKWGDRSNWLTHEQVAPYEKIGWFPTPEQGILVVDLDGCRDKETGVIHSKALGWIQQSHGYAEVSPSETGAKFYIRGTLPGNKPIISKNVPWGDPKGHTGIEIYAEKHFITVTGNIIPGCSSEINESPTVLNELLVRFGPPPKVRNQPKNEPILHGGTWNFDAWVRQNLEVFEVLDDGYIVTCPWANEHSTPGDTARIYQGPPHTFHCFHTHCNGRIWQDVRTHYEPDAYTSKSQLLPRSASMLNETLVPFHPSAAQNGNGGANGKHELPPVDEAPLPDVIIAGQMRDYVKASLDALETAEKREQTLFVQSAMLVKVGHDEQKRPIIIHVGVAELRNALTRSANFYREKAVGTGDNKIYEHVAIAPPKDLAEALLALNPSEWPFPALEAIVETPVLRPDFTILDTPGYDAATRLYYIPQAGLKVRKVPAYPTRAEREQAVALIEDAIGEFPYISDADKANAYAAEMTPILRPAIKRHIPLGLIDAPKPGTGKGLLADTISLTATGKTASILTAPDSENEWDKRITAILMQGRSIICIDNISGKLQTAALDATLTADEKEGRILGLSKMVQVPNRATWLATGNNIKLGGDLARRCYRIRLDPHVSRPWMRTGFKHEDLASWVTEHRGELIAAVLTLARAWYVAGQPQDESVPSLGTFTNWAKMLGGILKFAGVNGFLSNLEKLYEEADEDSAQWEAFLQVWLETFGDKAQLCSEVADYLKEEGEKKVAGIDAGIHLSDVLPDLLDIAWKDKPNSFGKKLAKQLERRLETCYGYSNLRLERRRNDHKKQWEWLVVAGIAGIAITHALSENQNSDASEQSNIKRGTGYNQYPQYPQALNGHSASGKATSDTIPFSTGAGIQNTIPANTVLGICEICRYNYAASIWKGGKKYCPPCKEKEQREAR